MTALDTSPASAPASEVVPGAAERMPRGRRPRGLRGTTRIRGVRAGFWVYAGLAAVLLASLFPFYWSLLIGSGDASTLNDPNMSWIPGGNFLANAATVVDDPAVNFWPALWNSIYSSALIAASVVITSTLAGWAFAKLRFPGSKPLLVFVVATMAVPMQLGVVPLYILFADLGWTGSIGAIIVPALTSAFGVFWMTQYLQQAVPDELIEAARVDGASMIRTFWTVGVVAARPAAAMLALFTFVTAWNNFFWPFIVLDRSDPTLPVALSLLQSNHFVDYSIVLAGVLLSTLPLLLLFVVAGKQLVSGIMQGAVKG
ncbi:carbohydrate ABC transporter permease [Agromyces sp. CCNWLW208]|uniref:carbohydrate ABC transporter permease n=1 Tax=unclassified Agromyces TaxID=2639701 RepID=UPI003FA56989